jgi:hypothetical protein
VGQRKAKRIIGQTDFGKFFIHLALKYNANRVFVIGRIKKIALRPLQLDSVRGQNPAVRITRYFKMQRTFRLSHLAGQAKTARKNSREQ